MNGQLIGSDPQRALEPRGKNNSHIRFYFIHSVKNEKEQLLIKTSTVAVICKYERNSEWNK